LTILYIVTGKKRRCLKVISFRTLFGKVLKTI